MFSFSAIFATLLCGDGLGGDSETSEVYLENMSGHSGLSQQWENYCYLEVEGQES